MLRSDSIRCQKVPYCSPGLLTITCAEGVCWCMVVEGTSGGFQNAKGGDCPTSRMS